MNPLSASRPSGAASIASYVLIALICAAVLVFHLLPAVIAGLLVYCVTRSIERRLLRQRQLSHWARMLAISVVIVVVCMLLTAIGLGIAYLVQRSHGFSGLLLRLAEIVADLRGFLPADIQAYIPEGVDELRARVATLLREHGQQVSTLGYGSVRASILALIGLVLGAMVSWNDAANPASQRPLSAALIERFARLTQSFQTVIFAQVRISALNTLLTAIYLVGILPLSGHPMPYTKSLVTLTFIAGLLPVVGNLISNTFIVLVSSTLSLQIAAFSLLFLVLIHKLEYFVNARIIGHRIDARAWEIVIAMITMEALFGVGGVVAAPVLYAYLKRELGDAGLIGAKRP
ncbi:AI-2E family transporter [Uliginosibacterium sp. sgz301328]